jgi:hypothetical protein
MLHGLGGSNPYLQPLARNSSYHFTHKSLMSIWDVKILLVHIGCSCSKVLVVIVIIFDYMLFTEFSSYLISYCLMG